MEFSAGGAGVVARLPFPIGLSVVTGLGNNLREVRMLEDKNDASILRLSIMLAALNGKANRNADVGSNRHAD